MGTVVQFPASSIGAERERGQLFGRWQRSKRGNLYTRTGEFCVTVFPALGGFRYAIARTARDKPPFSEMIYATSDEARRAAWAMLPKAFA
jgi:hypothetical protein